MEVRVFRDFNAFACVVGDIDAVMMLQNPARHRWIIERVELGGIHIKRGRLGSGNIVEGQSSPRGYGLYLPLSDNCEYLSNGVPIDAKSFMVLDPGSEFCISTTKAVFWNSPPSGALLRGGI